MFSRHAALPPAILGRLNEMEIRHGQQGAARQPREAQTEERETKAWAAHLVVLRCEHEARSRQEELRLAEMRRAPPTRAGAIRLLDRLFARSPIDNKLLRPSSSPKEGGSWIAHFRLRISSPIRVVQEIGSMLSHDPQHLRNITLEQKHTDRDSRYAVSHLAIGPYADRQPGPAQR
jgi:hypothetical protein